jgi:hypothetical protein
MPASIAKETPENSVSWIKENRPQGRIFNSYNWGGYLTWTLQDYPVFIDGRADLFGDDIIQDWTEISNGTERGLALLDEYKIQLIYLEPHHRLLEKLSPEIWEKTYEDEKIVIFQKFR